MTKIKKYKNDIREILNMLKDMNLKLDHIIERLKQTYNYLNAITSTINSKH